MSKSIKIPGMMLLKDTESELRAVCISDLVKRVERIEKILSRITDDMGWIFSQDGDA